MNFVSRFFALYLALSASLLRAGTPQQLTGQLVNATRQPVPYATIGVLNTPIGTVADAQGRFILFLGNKVNPTDTVRISLIGYKPANMTVNEFRHRLASDSLFVLIEEVRQLSEIRVRAAETKVLSKGKASKWGSTYTNFALSELPRQNLGAEIGRRFRLVKGENRLDKFQFYIMSGFDTVRFRVNVYDAKTMRNLLPQNIYVTQIGRYREWIEVDLLPYQLVAPNDVVVSIQWIDSAGPGRALMMPLQIPAAATHYYRYGSHDRWKRFPGMSTPMNLTFTRSKG